MAVSLVEQIWVSSYFLLILMQFISYLKILGCIPVFDFVSYIFSIFTAFLPPLLLNEIPPPLPPSTPPLPPLPPPPPPLPTDEHQGPQVSTF